MPAAVLCLVTGDTVRATRPHGCRSHRRSSPRRCQDRARCQSRDDHMTTFWHRKRHRMGVVIRSHTGVFRSNSAKGRFGVSSCCRAACISRDGAATPSCRFETLTRSRPVFGRFGAHPVTWLGDAGRSTDRENPLFTGPNGQGPPPVGNGP